MATEGTKIYYKCSDAEKPMETQIGSITIGPGTFKIETNKNADYVVSSQSFSFRSYNQLEEVMNFDPISITSNFMELLNTTSDENVKGVKLVEKHSKTNQ